MKRIKRIEVCNHQWENLYQFRDRDGKVLIQQKCKKCQECRYINAE